MGYIQKKYIRITAMKMIMIYLFLIVLMQLAIPTVTLAAMENLPYGYKRIAETSSLILYCNEQMGAIAVENRRSGYIWKSIVDDNVYDITSTNPRWQSQMTSMLILNYVNVDVGEGNLMQACSATDAKVISFDYTDNGITLTYSFDATKIRVTLEVKLEDNTVIYRIPAEKIIEGGDMGVVSVELMPFFGTADHKIDGYMLYPDGSGALTKYANIKKRPLKTMEYTWDVYGPKKVNLIEYEKREKTQKYHAMLPIYGIKNGSNAILAAVCQGIEDTSINFSPERFAVNLNRIFFEFTYRHLYNINLSNITVDGKSVSKIPVGIRVDKEMIKEDREVRMFFLDGEKANYSGMADVYRKYLIENNLIRKVIGNEDVIPLGLSLFMGIKEERILLDKFISMTSFLNAIEISQEFKKAGVDKLQVMLNGWTKGGHGLYPINWPPDKRLGGKSGLKKYVDYSSNNNIQLFFQNNFIKALAKNGGFSTRKDVVIHGGNTPVTDLEEKQFLLNPSAALRRVLNLLGSFRDVEETGVAMDGIGAIIYHDYNRTNPSSRVETVRKWIEMMETAQKENRSIAVEGGNQYVLRYADRLYNIPIKSSDYHITDETVPFYQMVVHGMIPYTAEPGNLSSDLTATKLKWIEYGCMPYFELTYQRSVNLKNTEYNILFTSYYLDWLRTATDIYEELNNKLKGLWGQPIITHDKMGENIYRVKYGNDTLVYINYNKRDIICDGYTIEAQNYLVVEKGGTIR